MRSAAALAVVALLWHAVFLLSVFDIHFRSPLVHGMSPHSAPAPPPARRLVLFVADGLRADAAFEMNALGQPRAPFLRGVMERTGAWGVSHTRVPTESRPGHVALLGGIYEDVSAVTRGWKSNPVAFDTVFNRSAFSFMLGSPDIVPMFSDALPAQAVQTHVYSADFEDFAGDPTLLDSWVLDAWLEHVPKHSRFNDSGTVHFLHLLGVDTSGHAYRPASSHYLAMVEHVDRLVRTVYERMQALHPDGRTAYVFTSDHGMSEKGSHGAGDPTETETPLVLWGAGVRGPAAWQPGDVSSPSSWAVDHLHRRDVEQADVAPLLATLLGVALPVNSVGVTPLDLLSVSPRDAAVMAECNAKQMLEQVTVKRARVAERLVLSRWAADDGEPRQLLQRALHLRQHLGDFEGAAAAAQQSVRASLRVLASLDRIDAALVAAVVVAAALGWMAVVVVWLSGGHVLLGASSWRHGAVMVLALVATFVLLWAEQAPPMYYVYTGLAVWLCGDALYRIGSSVHALRGPDWRLLLAVALALQAVVAGFFARAVYAALLALAALMAGLVWRSLVFAAALLVLAAFPLAPLSYGDAPWMVLAACVACVVLAAALLPWHRPLTRLHVASFALVTVLVVWGSLRHQDRLPLHPVAQALGWLLLLGNLLALGWAHAARTLLQFGVHVLLCVAAAYCLLSIAYEALFVLCLALALWQWVLFEREQRRGLRAPPSPLSMHSLRSALLYLLFTYAAFFGTGNSGSLSSFEISSTYRLVTVFNPFLMGALLALKELLPFVLISTAYAVVNVEHGAVLGEAFFVVLLLSDVLALNFFALVRNEGSWRDIGVSISHFGMANVRELQPRALFVTAWLQAHVLFQLLMFGLPRLLRLRKFDA